MSYMTTLPYYIFIIHIKIITYNMYNKDLKYIYYYSKINKFNNK